MSDLSVFAETYAEARGKFLDAARAAGARLTAYEHSAAKGPAGEPLYLDAALVGPADASRVFAVASGTHGIEGFPGSAAQTTWLRGKAKLPPDTAVLLLHANNPWGFAHKTRTTEDNVDLNRNFVSFDGPRPANAGYEEVHPNITPEEWNDATIAGIFRWLEGFRERVGEKAFSDAFNGGQYAHQDGLFFGGARLQWANGAFRHAVQSHLAHARQVSFMDLHTGIGPYGDHIYLCFHAEGSPARERARSWWGERAVNLQGVTHKKLATYNGVIIDAFAEMLPQAEVTSIVVEYGTRPREEMQRASMLQRWLRFNGQRDPARAKKLQSDYEAAFYPLEADWRRNVLEQSRDFLARGVAGIAAS
jgi:hypothetical protein